MPPPRRHGPLKEKQQITVRLDDQLLQLLQARLKRSKMRITDALEQGLALWLAHEDEITHLAHEARFLIHHATKTQQRQFLRFAAALVLKQIRPLQSHEKLAQDVMFNHLESLETEIPAALELYSRYGAAEEKTPADKS